MRIRRNRLKTYHCRSRIQKRDGEGSTYEEWSAAVSFSGELWPASGKLQVQQYGERLPYIRNLRVDGKYKMEADENGMITYVFESGLRIREADGLCLYVGHEQKPDYKIISIKPYVPLRLEAERI